MYSLKSRKRCQLPFVTSHRAVVYLPGQQVRSEVWFCLPGLKHVESPATHQFSQATNIRTLGGCESARMSAVTGAQHGNSKLRYFSCVTGTYQHSLLSVCLQKKSDCTKPPAVKRPLPKAASSAASCDSLFSSPDSPLSPCFRVVSTIKTPFSHPTPAANPSFITTAKRGNPSL